MQSPKIQAINLSREASQISPTRYHHIIVGADASHHSNRAIGDTIELAKIMQSNVTGAHVYAARLHDRRFRQMEGGLPEEFKEENELERQRDIHDQLITKGLSIITDSYLDQVELNCKKAGLDYTGCSLEGKNYREMVREARTGKYDLLVLGALGLGAIEGSRIGTVCERVVRRCDIDTLVIKQPERSLKDGPIVVAVDGSKKSFGGLITALTIAKHWNLPVHVISAYDPYYHYVAFNSIAKVLSDEAGRVFRFKEQEKLHEDIIDAGLAKIYQGHLQVAESIAQDFGHPVTTQLLDGKPHDVIEKYVCQLNASLLVIGKLGVHADDELDIGGNTENLLRNVACALLVGHREYTPEIEILAEATTSWTNQAEEHMKNIPSFARGMARTAILRFAQESGHTVVTEKIVIEATRALCPVGMVADNSNPDEHGDTEEHASPKQQIETLNPNWDAQAESLLAQVEQHSVRENLRHRIEKKARQQKSERVTTEHVEEMINQPQQTPPQPIHWHSAALARLNAVPVGFMRDNVKSNVIERVQQEGLDHVDLELIEHTIKQSSKAMKQQINTGDGQCPFKKNESRQDANSGDAPQSAADKNRPVWGKSAQESLARVPAGSIRAMARKATETIASEANIDTIDAAFFANILSTFQSGSADVEESLEWTQAARDGIKKAPPVVQGMLVREIENLARQNKLTVVDVDTVKHAKAQWQDSGFFHLQDSDHRSAAAQIDSANSPANVQSDS